MMKYKSSPIGLFKQVGMYLFSYFLIFFVALLPFFFLGLTLLFFNFFYFLEIIKFSSMKQPSVTIRGRSWRFPPPHLLFLLLLLVLFLSFLGKHH